MSIVTKTGDDGTTALGGGKRVMKSDLRLHAYGTVDELNSILGQVLSSDALGTNLRNDLQRLQHLLFRLGADLAAPMDVQNTKRIEAAHVKELETWIARLEGMFPPLTAFILPGGSEAGSLLHVARTVCRRAERWAVALSESVEVNRQALLLLNRLGDYLFLAAREANRKSGAGEVKAEY